MSGGFFGLFICKTVKRTRFQAKRSCGQPESCSFCLSVLQPLSDYKVLSTYIPYVQDFILGLVLKYEPRFGH